MSASSWYSGFAYDICSSLFSPTMASSFLFSTSSSLIPSPVSCPSSSCHGTGVPISRDFSGSRSIGLSERGWAVEKGRNTGVWSIGVRCDDGGPTGVAERSWHGIFVVALVADEGTPSFSRYVRTVAGGGRLVAVEGRSGAAVPGRTDPAVLGRTEMVVETCVPVSGLAVPVVGLAMPVKGLVVPVAGRAVPVTGRPEAVVGRPGFCCRLLISAPLSPTRGPVVLDEMTYLQMSTTAATVMMTNNTTPIAMPTYMPVLLAGCTGSGVVSVSLPGKGSTVRDGSTISGWMASSGTSVIAARRRGTGERSGEWCEQGMFG